MSCIPDALIKTRNNIELVEIKTRVFDGEETLDGKVETNYLKVLKRWEHQIQFSLHVCNLKKGFLIIYDNTKKTIEVTEYLRDEEYMEKHLNRFVNYFVNKILLVIYEVRSQGEPLTKHGKDKIIRTIWDKMAENETRLNKFTEEGQDHFKTLYNSLSFTCWNN